MRPHQWHGIERGLGALSHGAAVAEAVPDGQGGPGAALPEYEWRLQALERSPRRTRRRGTRGGWRIHGASPLSGNGRYSTSRAFE